MKPMKIKLSSISERPAVEFLPLSAAPPDCAFLLLVDGLHRAGLENSTDLVAAFRDGFKLIVYRSGSGGEMLVDALGVRLEAACLQGSRDTADERATEAA
jgi:hypothetical protein